MKHIQRQGGMMRGLGLFLLGGCITLLLGVSIYKSFSALDQSTDIKVVDTSPTKLTQVDMSNSTPTLQQDDQTIDEDTAKEEEAKDDDTSKTSTELSASDITTVDKDTLAYYIINGAGKTLLDLRSATEFQTSYIRTSSNYSVDNFKSSDFSPQGSYVLICDTGVCEDAVTLAEKISSITADVTVLEGGFQGWSDASYRLCPCE